MESGIQMIPFHSAWSETTWGLCGLHASRRGDRGVDENRAHPGQWKYLSKPDCCLSLFGLHSQGSAPARGLLLNSICLWEDYDESVRSGYQPKNRQSPGHSRASAVHIGSWLSRRMLASRCVLTGLHRRRPRCDYLRTTRYINGFDIIPRFYK